jgi:hypothetical protein
VFHFGTPLMDEAFYETPGCVFFLCVQRSKGKDVLYLEYWVVVMRGGAFYDVGTPGVVRFCKEHWQLWDSAKSTGLFGIL